MQCSHCQSEIPDNSKFCSQCGKSVDSILISTPPVPERPKASLIDALYPIVAILIIILGLLSIFTYQKSIGLIFSSVAIFLGILCLIEIYRIKRLPNWKKILGWSLWLGILIIIIWYSYPILRKQTPGYKISQVRSNLQTIATALESYYVDYMSYPRPDFDALDNPVIPISLTTPIAFLVNLPRDPFRDQGTGLYGYAGCPVEGGSIKTHYYYSDWIVTSYGPDKKDGNSGVLNGFDLREENACNDSTFIDFFDIPLSASPLTYDPTNGLKSPGDIWRRGPRGETSP